MAVSLVRMTLWYELAALTRFGTRSGVDGKMPLGWGATGRVGAGEVGGGVDVSGDGDGRWRPEGSWTIGRSDGGAEGRAGREGRLSDGTEALVAPAPVLHRRRRPELTGRELRRKVLLNPRV